MYSNELQMFKIYLVFVRLFIIENVLSCVLTNFSRPFLFSPPYPLVVFSLCLSPSPSLSFSFSRPYPLFSLYLSLSLSLSLSFYLSLSLFICLYLCLSLSLSISFSLPLSISFSLCLFLYSPTLSFFKYISLCSVKIKRCFHHPPLLNNFWHNILQI